MSITLEINEPILNEFGNIADELNMELYVVGGFVRDYFLQRPNYDIDFTVVGDSIGFAKEIAKRYKSEAILFENFKTAMVPINKFKFEFVGTRKEEYTPNSRKPIVSDGALEDDLRRRDFTVNAMAICINSSRFGELIDLFGGIQDLNKGILKTPLNPEITYSDDPLRMMRGARFASKLEFELDGESTKAIAKMADRIKIISQERITDEFLKILSSRKPSIGLKILYESGLMKFVFPELNMLGGVEYRETNGKTFGHKDVFYHSLKVLDTVAEQTENIWLRFAALVHDIGKPKTKRFDTNAGWTYHAHEEIGAKMLDKIFRDMKFPLDKINYVKKLTRLHQRPKALVESEVTDSAIRRLCVEADEALEDLFTLCRADITTKDKTKLVDYLKNYDLVAQKVIEVQERDQLKAFQSPVKGEEIMQICQLSPSPLVGHIKIEIEEAILDGIIPNERDSAMNYLLANKARWIEEFEEKGKRRKRDGR